MNDEMMSDDELAVFVFGIQLAGHLHGAPLADHEIYASLKEIADGDLVITPTHAEERLRLSKMLPAERVREIEDQFPDRWREQCVAYKSLASRILNAVDHGSTDG